MCVNDKREKGVGKDMEDTNMDINMNLQRIDEDNSLGELSYSNVTEDILYVCRSYNIDNYFIIKGGVALTKLLKDIPVINPTLRLTVDLDLHWLISEQNKWIEFVNQIEMLLNKESKFKFKYNIIKHRGFSKNPNGDSITLNVSTKDSKHSLKFKIDMNYGNYIDSSIMLDNLLLYPVEFMLADKITVISSKTVYRRFKDVVDIYNLSYYTDYNYEDLIYYMNLKRDISLLSLDFIYNNIDYDLLNKAYESLNRIRYKPPLHELLNRVLNFVTPLLSKGIVPKTWDRSLGCWLY